MVFLKLAYIGLGLFVNLQDENAPTSTIEFKETMLILLREWCGKVENNTFAIIVHTARDGNSIGEWQLDYSF
jgi:hypothetical protein